MTAEQVIDALGLEYLDGEGCWIRLLWRTEHANAIYALLTQTNFSAMHRLVEDEACVELLLQLLARLRVEIGVELRRRVSIRRSLG